MLNGAALEQRSIAPSPTSVVFCHGRIPISRCRVIALGTYLEALGLEINPTGEYTEINLITNGPPRKAQSKSKTGAAAPGLD